MDITTAYDIPFKGLKEGEHRYGFDLGNEFFGHYDTCSVSGGNVHAEVTLKKGSTVMTLKVTMRGEVQAECDRCLEPCTLPVDFDGGFTVRFGSQGEDFDGEILWLDQSESILNIGTYLYESIVLSLPVKRVHQDPSQCDPRMASHVSQEEPGESAETEESIDPRWDKLREIREKME